MAALAGTLVAVKLAAVVPPGPEPRRAALGTRLLAGRGWHLAPAETANLFLGHALYALAVAGIAFFAAALAESAATAAIVTLAFTLGFWVLDFAAATGPEWLKTWARFRRRRPSSSSSAACCRRPMVSSLAGLGLGLAALAALILPPGLSRSARFKRGAAGAAVLVAAAGGDIHAELVARCQRGPAQQLQPRRRGGARPHGPGTRHLALHLAPEDSRAQEYERNVLAKLKRLVPGLTVRWA
jgi:ABC-2 type transport system permease protein